MKVIAIQKQIELTEDDCAQALLSLLTRNMLISEDVTASEGKKKRNNANEASTATVTASDKAGASSPPTDSTILLFRCVS